MPPRWLCIGTVAFWLATTGWLVWSEVRDEFDIDEPSWFAIDLVDEAPNARVHTHWYIWQETDPAAPIARKDVSSATSWIEHHEKQGDTFSLHFLFQPYENFSRMVVKGAIDPPIQRLELGTCKLKRMESVYRVDRSGRLLGIKTEFEFIRDEAQTKDEMIELEGEASDGEFNSRYVFTALLRRQEKRLDSVPIKRRGAVLLPMHPVHRVRGLRPGRTWQTPFIDPLADALANTSLFGSQPSAHNFSARVLPELQKLPHLAEESFGKVEPFPCHVVEFDGDNTEKLRTWIRAADGLVLRQEVERADKRLILQRQQIPDVSSEP